MAATAAKKRQDTAGAGDRSQDRLRAAMSGLLGRLDREAEDRVSKRQTLEKRWIQDLRQLNGEYEPDIKRRLKDAKKSELFINQTRPKTNACDARLGDMLFPTDDKNYGIQPSPVPELTEGATRAVEEADRLAAEANAQLKAGDEAGSQATIQQAQQHRDAAAQADKVMAEARRRSDMMAREIDDQLKACNYQVQAREVIRDACRIGTGVMKGPVGTGDRARRGWTQVDDPQSGAKIYQLGWHDDVRPAFYRVDPWAFFPTPDARCWEEVEDTFERHLLTPKRLRALARQPGFDKDAIRRVLGQGANKARPTYLSELRGITGEQHGPMGDVFIMWEYRGCISADEMVSICSCLGKEDKAAQYQEADPLDEIQVAIWFCQGEILKIGEHHLDSYESIYSVYALEKDDASIWGYGIPYLMRDSQAALNGAWRMMMDNGGLSVGPQIVVNRNAVDPADGDEGTIYGLKVWLWKEGASPTAKPFEVHNIDSHQAELGNIIELAKQFIDDETAISTIAQGEQGAHTSNTLGGMAILMNAVNVVFRRMVKNWDDDMTVPSIRRLYDWNMQFSKKEEIKGDYEVDARGSSVLLVRELQSQNLMVMVGQLLGHPVVGQMLKAAPLVRKLVQSMMIAADEVVKTDEEMKRDAEAAAQSQGQDIEELKLESAERMQERDIEARIYIADRQQETELIKLAETGKMTMEQLQAKLALADRQQAGKERIFAAEAGFKARREREARAAGMPPPNGKSAEPAGTRFAP